MSHTYEELSDLRAFPADVRVYSYVLHLLEPTVVSGNPTRQYAGQWTLDAVDRNLLPRADEFLVRGDERARPRVDSHVRVRDLPVQGALRVALRGHKASTSARTANIRWPRAFPVT